MTIRIPLSIDAAHPAFAGHFPGRPIVPGVVLLDESLRAIAAHRGATGASSGGTPIRIGAVKFLSIVGPGEPLRLEVDASDTAEVHGYRLRVIAGPADDERVALTGSIAWDAPGSRSAIHASDAAAETTDAAR